MISLTAILALVAQYKYILLFPIAFLEGPIISIIGGFLASTGKLNLAAVYIVVLLGDLIADTIYYWLGRKGGLPVLKKYGRYLFLSDMPIEHLESHFAKHAGKTLFIAKFAHGLGTIVLFAAGLSRMPYRKFIVFNFLSASLKSLILVLIGYYFGYALQRINDYLSYASYILLGAAVLLICGYVLFVRRMRRELL